MIFSGSYVVVVLVLEDIMVVIEVMIQARKIDYDMFPAHHRNATQNDSAAIANSSLQYFGNNSKLP
jgi:hypothetical protein